MNDAATVARSMIAAHPSTVTIGGREVAAYLSPAVTVDPGDGTSSVRRTLVISDPPPETGEPVGFDREVYIADTVTDYGGAAEIELVRE